MLRCSLALEKMVAEEARRQHISLAEQHRQIIAHYFSPHPRVKVIPLVGEVGANDVIHYYQKAA